MAFTSAKAPSKNKRLDWLIAARGYAMFGVFIVHVAICYVSDQHISSLLIIAKLLEPAVVPFFTIIIGAFYTQTATSFKQHIRLRFAQRMYPVYFYLLLILPFYILLPHDGKTSTEMLPWVALYIMGIPFLSWSSWFLVALFTSEMLYYFIRPLAYNHKRSLLIAFFIYSFIWTYNHFVPQLPSVVGMLGMVWMLQAACLFCVYFLIGRVLKDVIMALSNWHARYVFLLLVISLSIAVPSTLYNTYTQPHPEHFRALFRSDMMVIPAGVYGNYFLFISSTLCSAMALLCFSRLMPVNYLIKRCGDYSLILLGLNGIFLGVINRHIAQWLTPSDNFTTAFPYAFGVATATLLICLPIAIALAKYLPQLTGKPMLKGPILPALYKSERSDA